MDCAILKTQQWLDEIIIGLNFCPFAKKEFVNNTIHYEVSSASKVKVALELLALQCEKLVNSPEIETSLIIFDGGFRVFERYLDLVEYANELIVELGYEGVFQLASFHPEYCFEGEDYDDAANYTNRSPLPTLHIIREDSMAKVLNFYKNPEEIPENNIALAQKKGANYFQQILNGIDKKYN
jgi:hypothetical protein